jgi:acetyl esterase
MSAFPSVAEMIAAHEANGPAPETRAEATTEALVERYPILGAVRVEDVAIDGPHGPVDARTYTMGDGGDLGLLWMHGGAWVAGSLDMPEAHWVALTVAAAGIPVVSADYRKALHGVRYPVPSDDVLAAWCWATEHVPCERFVIGGASAGANLAAGVAKRLRDGAGPAAVGVMLAYPLLHPVLPTYDDTFKATMRSAREGTFLFGSSVIRELTLNYTGAEAVDDDPYAFAANGDLDGFPPTLIVNSEFDTLRASGEVFGAALSAAGVETVVEMERGTVHGHLDQPLQPEGGRTLDRFVRWLRDH